MSEYEVVSVDESGSKFDPEDLSRHIISKWPDSNVQVGPAYEGDPATMNALVATSPQRLTVYVDRSCRLVGIEPTADREAAEFVSWLMHSIVNFTGELRLYSDDGNKVLVLRDGIERTEILAHLVGGAS